MWSLERNEAGWRLGRTLELYSQDQPIATIFAKSGQAPPQVCVLETLSCASEDEPEVWSGVCMHSKHASQWPWKGPPGTVVTAFRGSLLQRSGNLLSFQTLASPEVPREPSSPFLHSMHDSDRHRNSLVPHSLRGSAMCLCTTSTLQYLLTAIFSSFLSVFHFQTSNHRPFSFIVEHNHQEISQGEEKKNNKTNKQEPLFIGISKYTK